MIWVLLAIIVIMGVVLYGYRQSIEDLIERVEKLEDKDDEK